MADFPVGFVADDGVGPTGVAPRERSSALAPHLRFVTLWFSVAMLSLATGLAVGDLSTLALFAVFAPVWPWWLWALGLATGGGAAFLGLLALGGFLLLRFWRD